MSSRHLSDEQLAAFLDGEPVDAGHLANCAGCSGRLDQLRLASEAYREYETALRSSVPPAPRPWPSFETLISPQAQPARWWRPLVPLVAAAAAACLVWLVRVQPEPQQDEASAVLARSSDEPVLARRTLAVRQRGRTLFRPAMLVSDGGDAGLSRIRNLFENAEYSWREPLSARSFERWRTRLKRRQDRVTRIGTGYRVSTATSDSTLQNASLVLTGQSLRPTSGEFQFQGAPAIEIAETTGVSPDMPRSAPAPVAAQETLATPADTLRVLAALHRIGADVGEPVEVVEERQNVAVRLGGLAPARRDEVAAALSAVPRVRLDQSVAASANRTLPSERFTAGLPAAARQRLEERLGGAAALEQVTDRALELSSSVLARAHAVETLARHFPAAAESALSADDRRTLDQLRAAHAAELRRLTGALRHTLEPLLAVPAASAEAHASWQARAHALTEAAESADRALSRVLAGSYQPNEADTLLAAAANSLSRAGALLGDR